MRSLVLSFAAILVSLSAPAYADSLLSFDLDSNIGYGSPTNTAADADSCSPPNCVLFSGTLFDNDTIDPYLYLNYITVTFSAPGASGFLTVDNTFSDNVPFFLIGDPSYDFNSYGDSPIFGIDIAPGAPAGDYTGTVQILGGVNGFDSYDDNDNLLPPSTDALTPLLNFSVVVTPEPSAAHLALAGLLGLAAWSGVKRKLWSSPESSR